jgi:DNA-binding response OmpR family regulator
MNSPRVLLLAKESEDIREIVEELIRRGFVCTIVSSEEELASSSSADLLLIEAEDELDNSALKDMTQQIKKERNIPIILLVNREMLSDIENDTYIEDFILKPYDFHELQVRINRLLKKYNPRKESEECLKSGDIIIDIPRCEVSVAGKAVDLTFTEYELLKLLMSKKGHVFTREVLLNKIWGYNYFGGDRTVDVHITRLRSKIEDPSHSFIETVRNIGYRIKENDK